MRYLKLSQPKLTSRQLQAENTKRRIFNAAFDLLHKMDIQDVKISDILTAAGVSPGTFYHYFKSKWDVFYASHTFLDEYFEEEVEPLLTQPHIQERLSYFFAHYILYHSQNRNTIQYLRIILNTDNPVFRRSFYADTDYGLLHVLRGTIQQAIDEHEFSDAVSATEIAAFLMTSFRGILFDWCARDGAYNIFSKTDAYIVWFIASFYAK